MVLPVPGAPATTVSEPTGNPPPRTVSSLGIPVLSLFTLGLSFAPCSSLACNSSDTSCESGCVERLADDRVHKSRRLKAACSLGVAGHDDDRNRGGPRLRSKPVDQLKSAHDWHHQVGHDDVREGVRPDHLEHKTSARVVVDDQDCAQPGPRHRLAEPSGSNTESDCFGWHVALCQKSVISTGPTSQNGDCMGLHLLPG